MTLPEKPISPGPHEHAGHSHGWVWAVVIIGVIISLLFSCIVGALAGYLAARQTIKSQPAPESRLILPTPLPFPQPPQPPQPPDLSEQLPFMAGAAGALVREVMEGSPAAKAGLQPGDIIRAVDGRRLTKEYTLADAIAQKKPGDRIILQVFRDGQTERIRVQLGPHAEDPTRAYLGVWFIMVDAPGRFLLPPGGGGSD